jgi:urease
MQLCPRELDKLVISQLGQLAQRRLARGVKLNHIEATALIANNLQEVYTLLLRTLVRLR